MRKNKGFTLLEMVIVIAVIAILTAILIPTFSNIFSKARETKRVIEVTDAVTNYVIDNSFEKFGEVDPRFIFAVYKDDEEEYCYHQNSDKEFVKLDIKPYVLECIEPLESSINENVLIYDFSPTDVCMRAYLLYLYEQSGNGEIFDLSFTRFYDGTNVYKHTTDHDFVALAGLELETILENEPNISNRYICEEYGLTLLFLG